MDPPGLVWGLDLTHRTVQGALLVRPVGYVRGLRHDIKSGNSPCTDELFLREKERFEDSASPLVYVPGDNEWTDCERTGYDPIERLERLREIFFEGEESLGERSEERVSRNA